MKEQWERESKERERERPMGLSNPMISTWSIRGIEQGA